MTIITVHPDGTTESREPTADELAQAALDQQAVLDAAWQHLRVERNQRLADSDWTQVADAPVDRYNWAEYRQHLRDLPANTTDPTAPVWPTPPA